MAKKDRLQYAALKRAKRIGKKGLKIGSLASTIFLVGGSTPRIPSRNKVKKGLSAGLSAGSYSAGALGASKEFKRIATDMSTTSGQKKRAFNNSLSNDENKAMRAKAEQMNAQIKKDQKKASDFKTLMERWNYENDNANPKGGRSDYGSGWSTKNVNKRNAVRKMASTSKTKKGMAK